MKDKKILKIVFYTLVVVALVSVIYFCFLKEDVNPSNAVKGDNTLLDYKLIHESNYINDNYLISPLSIAYAINMLKEGSSNNTKVEIESLLNKYNIPEYNLSKDRIGIANAIFIKDEFKNDISEDYKNILLNNFNSEVIFDKFKNPDTINNWIKDKTYEMIPKLLDEIDSNFVLGIANALAIDVEWKNGFDCNKTVSKEFTKYDNTVINVPMMSTDNDIEYIENNNAIGIVKPYKMYDTDGNEVVEKTDKTTELEFIALLPKNDIKEYINNFSYDELNNLLTNKINTDNKKLTLNIPRFNYEYTLNNFKEILITLGMKDAFDYKNADFSNMLKENHNEELDTMYIDKAIHKTKIELNETGTKAAAATFFEMRNFSAYEEPEKIEVNLNRPFVYLIKEKESDNIWFFGTVYEPTVWNQDTKSCDEQKR